MTFLLALILTAQLTCTTDTPDCGAHECADPTWTRVGYVTWVVPDGEAEQQVLWCKPSDVDHD